MVPVLLVSEIIRIVVVVLEVLPVLHQGSVWLAVNVECGLFRELFRVFLTFDIDVLPGPAVAVLPSLIELFVINSGRCFAMLLAIFVLTVEFHLFRMEYPFANAFKVILDEVSSVCADADIINCQCSFANSVGHHCFVPFCVGAFLHLAFVLPRVAIALILDLLFHWHDVLCILGQFFVGFH